VTWTADLDEAFAPMSVTARARRRARRESRRSLRAKPGPCRSAVLGQRGVDGRAALDPRGPIC
jgi:hypothetical protein